MEFTSMSTEELLEHYGRVAHLDLHPVNPVAQNFNPGNRNSVVSHCDAYKLLLDRGLIENVNEHLKLLKIAALDLATPRVCDDPARFRREIQGREYKYSVALPNGRVKIMDFHGRLLFNAWPFDWAPIPNFSGSKYALTLHSKPNFTWVDKSSNTDVADRAGPKPLESFTLFTQLPIELQAAVWRRAARNCEARTILARKVECGKWEIHGSNLPDLMKVNRYVTNDVLTAKIYKPMFKCGGQKAVYFNPDKDILHISAPRTRCPTISQCNLLSHLADPSDMTKVRHLVMDLQILESNFFGAMVDINAMPQLRDFTLSGTGNNHRSVRIEMEFQDVEGDGQTILPIYESPYGVEAGPRAFHGIMHEVSNMEEINRLQMIPDLLQDAYGFSNNLPGYIILKIQYFG